MESNFVRDWKIFLAVFCDVVQSFVASVVVLNLEIIGIKVTVSMITLYLCLTWILALFDTRP